MGPARGDVARGIDGVVEAGGAEHIEVLGLAGEAVPQLGVLGDAVEAAGGPAEAAGRVAADLRGGDAGVSRGGGVADGLGDLDDAEIEEAVIEVGLAVAVDVLVAGDDQRVGRADELHEAGGAALLVVPLGLLDAEVDRGEVLAGGHALEDRVEAVDALAGGGLVVRAGVEVGAVPGGVDVGVGEQAGDRKARGEAGALAVHHQLVAGLRDLGERGPHVEGAEVGVAADDEAVEVGAAHLDVLVARRGGADEEQDVLAVGAAEGGTQDVVAVAPRERAGGGVGGELGLGEVVLVLEDLDLAGEELGGGVEDEAPGAGELGVGRGGASEAAQQRLGLLLIVGAQGRAAHRQQRDGVGPQIGARLGAGLGGDEGEDAGGGEVGDGAEAGILEHGGDDVREHGERRGAQLGGVERIDVGGSGGSSREHRVQLGEQGLGLGRAQTLGAQRLLGVEGAGGEQALEAGGAAGRDPARRGDEDGQGVEPHRGGALGVAGEGAVGEQEEGRCAVHGGGEVEGAARGLGRGGGGRGDGARGQAADGDEVATHAAAAAGEVHLHALAEGEREDRAGVVRGGAQLHVVVALADQEEVHADRGAGRVEALAGRGSAGHQLGGEGVNDGDEAIIAAYLHFKTIRHGGFSPSFRAHRIVIPCLPHALQTARTQWSPRLGDLPRNDDLRQHVGGDGGRARGVSRDL
ncbi:hypothetical protein [Nannocystis sp.]|uniref:hypothetical protein n=1 Tax=Nannocystis sp. TaxID=1962667 RepID=UPI0025E9151D|nr:hypothetical protein [Nannocystis sp.]